MDDTEQFRRLLLNEAGPLAAEAVVALCDPTTCYRPVGPLPHRHVRRIYGIRAQINCRNNHRIAGFDTLLDGLDALPDEEVLLHSLEMPRQTYLVFTNAAVTTLAGTLRIPARLADTTTTHTAQTTSNAFQGESLP